VLEELSEQEGDLPTMRQQASAAIDVLQKENCERYNKKRKILNSYKEDDYVMIRNVDNIPGVNKKFILKYKRALRDKKDVRF